MRPGTVAVPLAVGFGEASRIARCELHSDMERTGHLAETLYEMLRKKMPKVQLFGHPSRRLPGNLNIGFPGISGDDIVDRVGDYLAISTGSACSSTVSKTSHVLQALNLGDETVQSAVRISIGRFMSTARREVPFSAR